MAKHRSPTRAQSWPKRGEIYLTALEPTVGHEIRKTRPALVIQNDIGNEFSATTIVAPVSSTVLIPLSPVHVVLAESVQTGLFRPSVALLNQIRTVDRRRLMKRLGTIDRPTMDLVDEAIMISLGLMF
jgi:mRNA interferase MazF